MFASTEQLQKEFAEFLHQSRPAQRALTVLLYAWSALGAALALGTIVNIFMVIF